ncbi:transposase [Streptomyces mobaraensis]|uniref:Transposase n=1 Tax=Streptomyces mobaraensis TaxID=35621 RepID=A0A5N5W6S2_STRMB|nr:transposase [Streptomyces mobaraensis]
MSSPALSTRPSAPDFRSPLALSLPAPAPTVLTGRLVPDDLWHLAKEAIPPTPKRPQGGGQRRVDDREVLAAIVFVAGSGCSWRRLPPVFGASWQTVHRRFTEWSAAGLWDLLCAAAEHRAAGARTDWTLTVCRRIRARAASSAAAGSPIPPGSPGSSSSWVSSASASPAVRPADGPSPDALRRVPVTVGVAAR